MSVITLLDPMPGERILDLCAAPGGKSTGIAARMQGQGLLVSNEIILGRAKILSQNVERMGITNALVCNESPERIASHFPLFFDRIVVDAPCSGEGMFRKDAGAISEWSPENVTLCKERQEMILAYADAMLNPAVSWCILPVHLRRRRMKNKCPTFWINMTNILSNRGKIFFRQTVALKMAPLQVPCVYIPI